MFRIFDMRHLSNSVLLPLPVSMLRAFKLDGQGFRDMPRLNYIAVNCCSRLNAIHPGFYPAYVTNDEQPRAAESTFNRLFLENPLCYPIWPFPLTDQLRGSSWTETTFRALEDNDVLNFPKLTPDLINPVAIDICSGPHAIHKSDAVMTYMNQLLLKDENLTREEYDQRLQVYPKDWKLHYLYVSSTGNVPPVWWNEESFGEWHNLCLVRCLIPPSYKTATSRANFHVVIIGFGQDRSRRLNLRPPYDRIYFWRCFKCPALCGLMSMDRHTATLLKLLSYPESYRSTAKTVNMLNTVLVPLRQVTEILPLSSSASIPQVNPRHSRDRRSSDILYSRHYASSPNRPIADSATSTTTGLADSLQSIQQTISSQSTPLTGNHGRQDKVLVQ